MGNNVTFDPTIDTIIVTTAPVLEGSEWVVDLDVKIDVFSDGKEDWIIDSELNKRRFPISTAGGDDLPGSKQLGSTFFLEYGWKIRPYEASHTLRINGNIYSRDGSSPFIQTLGSYNVMVINTVSSLVDSTVQQLSEIEYASFNGGISYDSINGSPGIKYPIGTPQEPSNLMADAKIIAEERGFTTGFIIGDITFDTITDLTSFTFIGSSKSNTLITIPDAAIVEDCSFHDAEVTGVLDGESALYNCLVSDLAYINGYIELCVLSGTGIITLGGGGVSHFLSCYSGVPGEGTPIIDMGGSGQALAMRDYNGGILITNKTGLDAVSIDLASGQVKLDLDGNFGVAGVVAGSIIIRGDGKVTDATTGDYLPSGEYNGLTLLNETVGIDSFSASKYNDKVFIEIGSGHTKESYPIGLINYPADSIDIAKIILDKYHLNTFHFQTDASIFSGVDIQGYKITSHNNHITFIDGCFTSALIVEDTVLSGVLSGYDHLFKQCLLIDLININGKINECTLSGNITISGNSIFRNCIAPRSNPLTIDTGIYSVNFLEIRGFFSMSNVSGSVNVNLCGGQITLNPSCASGTIFIDNIGNGIIIDNSGVGCTVVIKEFSTASILGSDVTPYHDTDSLAGASVHLKHLSYKIFIDPDGISPGDGSQHHPYVDQHGAIDYAEDHGIKELVIYSDITITSNLKNFIIIGIGTPKIELTSIPNLKNSQFSHINLTGLYVDSITVQNAFLSGPVSINGFFETCAIEGELIVPDGGTAYLTKCTPLESTFTKPILNIGGATGTGTAILMGYRGGLLLINCNQSTDIIKINIDGGTVDIDSSCTDGIIMIIGTGKIGTDDSSGSCVVNTDNLINKAAIAEENWNGINLVTP